MKKESDKTRYKQINLYFVRYSLDKIKGLSIMRLGDRPTKKSKKEKSTKIRLSSSKQPISNWLKPLGCNLTH